MSKVEWAKLGEVCSVCTGKQLNKRDMQDAGAYPVINGGVDASGYVEVFIQSFIGGHIRHHARLLQS